MTVPAWFRRPVTAPDLPNLRTGATVFLDRDGTINRDIGYLTKHEDVELLPGAAEAIARLNARGYLVVVVTNQSVIARGMASQEEVDRANAEVALQVARASGGQIDAFYSAPTHPDFPNEATTAKADWRKPEAGMLVEAQREFGVNFTASWMVGDTIRDLEAGKAADSKIRTIILPSEKHDGYELADYTCDSLFEAAQTILDVDAGFCPIEDF